MKTTSDRCLRIRTLCCVFAILSLLFIEAARAQETDRSVAYVTIRDRVEHSDGGTIYGDERSDRKAGRCFVDETRFEILSSAAEIAPFRIPEEILSLRAAREEPLEVILNSFEVAPLLYVHGYFIDFDKGCRRASILQKTAELEKRFLWFSWPAEDALFDYARDEVNLNWSVPDIAQMMMELHDRFQDQDVQVAGHSLGARGVVMALNEVALTRPDIRFENVILLAPDIDFGLFEKLLPRLRNVAHHITVYISDADRALAVSERLHGYPRLGQTGNDVTNLTGVEIIDTSDLPTMSTNGHLYHIYNAEVGIDLNQLIQGSVSAAQRRNLVQAGENLWRLKPEE